MRTTTGTGRTAPGHRPVQWFLLLAVIAGILGMHVLTGGDHAAHGGLPMAAPAAHPASDRHLHPVHLADVRSTAPATSTDRAPDAGAAHRPDPAAAAGFPSTSTAGTDLGPSLPRHVPDGVVECVLFLVAGSGLIALALLTGLRLTRTRNAGRGSDHGGVAGRAPPRHVPLLLTLCVARI